MIWIWLVAWAGLVFTAFRLRNRFYAKFLAVVLGVQLLVWWGLFSELSARAWLAWPLSAMVFAHYASLIRPRMRTLPFRALVSWPALFFVAGSILALPWALLAALGVTPYGWWLPYVLAALGLVQSLTHRPATVDLQLDGRDAGPLDRAEHGAASQDRPLRIAHITDTHLGPFVSERRLRRALERVAERDPDLVLLTGDYMTMESSADPELLERAFAPLERLSGRVFACRGNHDHEAPDVVDRAFETLGIELLVDEEVVVDTPAGPVQLVGIDYKFQDAADRVRRAALRHPRRPEHTRVVLLHHPGHFTHIPDGLGDLVLSGHTHGGQLGLVDLGIDFTMMRLFVDYPDHGFWAERHNRLYVNRGLGHYGFPLRVGVRAEEALLRVHGTPPPTPS
jgi:hypothetical protein